MSTFQPPAPEMITAGHYGGASTPGLITMHSTVSLTRKGAARATAMFFKTEKTPTSAHYCVDTDEVIQCVPDHREAFHCGYNADSIGIEMCDMPNATSISHWLVPKRLRAGKRPVFHGRRINPLRWLEPGHRKMLQNTAQLVAELCLAYGIPPRLLTDAQLRAWDRAGRPASMGGIVTHAQMSRVFKRSTHWDPGRWPSQTFLRTVLRKVEVLKASA
jgi:hypothetical protein